MLLLFACVAVVYVVTVYGSSLWSIFFFQAEDGIRDLVRSRGLGDVYKRQVNQWLMQLLGLSTPPLDLEQSIWLILLANIFYNAVSYTHLTLPTSDLV